MICITNVSLFDTTKPQETISQNYAAIQLYPERFGDYLLSQVGFSTCEEIATSHHSAKGFRRPIHIFTKAQQQSQQPPEEQQQPPEEQQQQQPSSWNYMIYLDVFIHPPSLPHVSVDKIWFVQLFFDLFSLALNLRIITAWYILQKKKTI